MAFEFNQSGSSGELTEATPPSAYNLSYGYWYQADSRPNSWAYAGHRLNWQGCFCIGNDIVYHTNNYAETILLATYPTGTWYYLACIISANNDTGMWAGYRELGSADWESTHTHWPDAVAGPHLIGNNDDAGNYRTAYHRVWDDVLTPAQLFAEADSPTPIITANLRNDLRGDNGLIDETGSTWNNSGPITVSATMPPLAPATPEPAPQSVTPTFFASGETGIVVSGSDFGTSGATVELSNTANGASGYVAQTTTQHTADNSITFTCSNVTGLNVGSQVFLFVQQSGERNATGLAVDLKAVLGSSYTTAELATRINKTGTILTSDPEISRILGRASGAPWSTNEMVGR